MTDSFQDALCNSPHLWLLSLKSSHMFKFSPQMTPLCPLMLALEFSPWTSNWTAPFPIQSTSQLWSFGNSFHSHWWSELATIKSPGRFDLIWLLCKQIKADLIWFPKYQINQIIGPRFDLLICWFGSNLLFGLVLYLMQSQLRSMQTNTAIFGSNLVGRKSGDTSAGIEVLANLI